jgi:Zn-dependent protease
MSSFTVLIFELLVLIFSVMVHEISHGVIALRLGDTTAKDAGRLTLNPLKHIDPFGSIILPLLMALPALFGVPAPIFGWAKPVPYNPMNLSNPRRGAGIIAAAGPLSNLLLAAVFGILIRILTAMLVTTAMVGFIGLLNIVVLINISLAIFNLLPIPPLDGSNVLFAFLPERYAALRSFLMRHGFTLLLLFIFFGFSFISPIIEFVYRLFVGSAGMF